MNLNDAKNKQYEKVQRIVRIKPDYLAVCSYLDFIAKKNKRDLCEFYNDLFISSLDYISKNGFKYYIIPYKPRRTPKGLQMLDKTSSSIDDAYKFLSNIYYGNHMKKLYIAEFIELLLYIYVMNNLSEAEIENIGIEFGIKKLE